MVALTSFGETSPWQAGSVKTMLPATDYGLQGSYAAPPASYTSENYITPTTYTTSPLGGYVSPASVSGLPRSYTSPAMTMSTTSNITPLTGFSLMGSSVLDPNSKQDETAQQPSGSLVGGAIDSIVSGLFGSSEIEKENDIVDFEKASTAASSLSLPAYTPGNYIGTTPTSLAYTSGSYISPAASFQPPTSYTAGNYIPPTTVSNLGSYNTTSPSSTVMTMPTPTKPVTDLTPPPGSEPSDDRSFVGGAISAVASGIYSIVSGIFGSSEPAKDKDGGDVGASKEFQPRSYISTTPVSGLQGSYTVPLSSYTSGNYISPTNYVSSPTIALPRGIVPPRSYTTSAMCPASTTYASTTSGSSYGYQQKAATYQRQSPTYTSPIVRNLSADLLAPLPRRSSFTAPIVFEDGVLLGNTAASLGMASPASSACPSRRPSVMA